MTITAMHEPIWINQLQTRRQDLTRGVIDAVRAALLEIYAGRPVVVIDRSAPDHPGHLMMAARRITDADVAWLVRHTSGVLCVPLPAETCDRLHLAQMVRHNPGASAPAFTVSVDAAAGITTGISAADRGITIRLLADPAAEPDDLSRPGHVFPIRAEDGGVLRRPGLVEAAVDLTRLAGVGSAAVTAAIVNDDEADVTATDVAAFARAHNLQTVDIDDLVTYLEVAAGL